MPKRAAGGESQRTPSKMPSPRFASVIGQRPAMAPERASASVSAGSSASHGSGTSADPTPRWSSSHSTGRRAEPGLDLRHLRAPARRRGCAPGRPVQAASSAASVLGRDGAQRVRGDAEDRASGGRARRGGRWRRGGRAKPSRSLPKRNCPPARARRSRPAEAVEDGQEGECRCRSSPPRRRCAASSAGSA